MGRELARKASSLGLFDKNIPILFIDSAGKNGK